MMNNKPQRIPASKGMTLIEVLVVVIILGVITVIALPNYQSFIQSSRRADALTELMSQAQRMERDFTTNGRYTEALNGTSVESESCFYNLTYTVAASTFSITATPFTNTTSSCNGKANGSKPGQSADKQCKNLTINQALSLTSTNSTGGSSTSSCIKS